MTDTLFEHRFPVGSQKPSYERHKKKALEEYQRAGGQLPAEYRLEAHLDKAEKMVVVTAYE